MSNAAKLAITWVEQGYVPDNIIRHSVRRLLKRRLQSLPLDDCERLAAAERDFVAMMDASPVALLPEKANEQHYELPPAFFEYCLGKNGKYSCCYWPQEETTLDEAEEAALALTCERAGLADGIDILELGCGWGSLTLWMAQQYPASRITAVSNSAPQRAYIEARAASRGLANIRVLTRDMNDFDTNERFDRVVSVEMFEHMRNYRELFARISRWLNPGGRFFMHIFCHRSAAYVFEDRGETDWMSRNFFSGGIMPSDSLPLNFQDELKILARWRWDGRHYEKTANAWLEKMDKNREPIMDLLRATYGRQDAGTWWMRWRIFYIACAELFGYDSGQQWWVGHYLFQKTAATQTGDVNEVEQRNHED